MDGEVRVNSRLGLFLLLVGVILLVLGLVDLDSLASGISRLFTGHPTGRTLWLLGGGLIAVALAGILLWRKDPA